MNEGKKMMDYCDESSESRMDDDECKLKQFEKNKYFYGKLMTVADFQLEQSYFNKKRHIINRLIHGVGVVCGLEVSEIKKIGEKCVCGPEGDIRMVGEKWAAVLSAGSALDCTGREIIVSKSGTWTISEKKSPEELRAKFFGLYLKRKDISKSPVPSPANTSSCEEVCCYSRTEENFELVFDVLPEVAQLTFDSSSYSVCDIAKIILIEPKGNTSEGTRKVKLNYVADPSAGQPIVSEDKELTKILNPKIELAAADVFTADIELKLESFKGGGLLTVEYELNAQKLKSTAYIQPAPRSELYPKLEKKKIADDYYRHWLKECTCCADPQDPKVLLAVLSKKENELLIEGELTAWYRNIVYNNPMLYDLISCHMVDKNNPHEVTAEQVRALKTINGVGNKDRDTCPVSNVNLIAGEGITITSDDGKKEIRVDASSGIRATSGLFKHSLKGQSLFVSETIKHHAVGQKGIPPAIVLGEEMVSEEGRSIGKIRYMEDLLLARLLGRFLTQDFFIQENVEEINRFELGEFFILDESGRNLPIFFKAIHIDQEEFRILLVNYSKLIEQERTITIRWQAIPSIGVRKDVEFKPGKSLYKTREDVGITIVDAAANRDPRDVEVISNIKVFSESDTVGKAFTVRETDIDTGEFTLSFSLNESESNGIRAENLDKVTVEYPDVLDPQKKFTFSFTVGVTEGDTSIINISTIKLKDLEGNELTELTVNKEAFISTSVKNTKNEPQPFLAYTLVRDSSGKIVSTQRQSGNLSPGIGTEISVTWKPEVPGEYKVRIFVIHPESNAMLSSVAESTVKAS